MKKVQQVFLGLVVLLAFGCGKDDDGGTPLDPNNTFNQKCKLVSITNARGLDTVVSEIEYNVSGRISKITNIKSGTEISSGNIEFDGNGKVIKYSINNGDYTTYEYNSNGQLVKESFFYALPPSVLVTLQTISTYEYDSNNKLIKENSFKALGGSALESYVVYDYPGGNSVISKKYTTTSGGPTHVATEEFTFDDKNSSTSLLGVIAKGPARFSKHNVLTQKYTPAGPPPVFVSTLNYVYQYNADDYPTKATLTSNGAILSTQTIVYNCL